MPLPRLNYTDLFTLKYDTVKKINYNYRRRDQDFHFTEKKPELCNIYEQEML